MHIDARTAENGSLIEGDICIVGAGAAGISMALDWANTSHKVILLEGGGFELEAELQHLYHGKTTGQRYFPLQSSRLHYFGGTTGHWAGFCSTFDPIDFKKRDWVPYSGWPFKKGDLDPFYSKAQKILDLGPYEYDVSYWLNQDPALAALPFDEKFVQHKVWQFSPPSRFGKKYKEEVIKTPNIHLYTYANLTQIETNEAGSRVKELYVKNLAGKSHTVKAKHYVLACSAIQNARLLLASNHRLPKGLGNHNDLVGKFFMEHLEVTSAELMLTSPRALPLYLWEAFTTKMCTELAISEAQQQELGILNGTASLWPIIGGEERAPMIDTFSEDAAERDCNKF